MTQVTLKLDDGGGVRYAAVIIGSDQTLEDVAAKVVPAGVSWSVFDPLTYVPTEKPITPAQVNTERTRRLAQGTTIEVTGYGSVAVQGRDQDQITVLALEASARDLTAASVTDPVIPFRDRDNVQHMLTPEQTTELMRKAKAFAQQIYQASWALKDADPVPQDYADDKHWP